MMASIEDILQNVGLVIAITLVVKSALLLRTRWTFQRALKCFPEHHRGIFFLGHAKAFLDGARGVLLEWDAIYDNNEKAMQVWMSPFTPGVVVYHPETIRAVFNTTEPKETTLYGYFLPWLGDGLLVSNGRKWARNRRLLTPAFHFDILKPYVKVFADSATHLTTKWSKLCHDGECSVELMKDFSLATLDSLIECVMGVKDDWQKFGREHPYVNANYVLTEQIILRFGTLMYQSDVIYGLSPDGFANRKALKIAHEFSGRVIAERKEHLEKSRDRGGSSNRGIMPFLDILLEAKDEDGQGLSDEEIQNEVDTFMFEGHDTTASALSWIFYNLAKHPELQEKCREEVDAVMEGKGGSALEWTDLSKFEYLTQFIKESMRIDTTVTFVGRRLESPIQLPDGRAIPKGASAFCHINGVHHNPHMWKDPMVFDPERFNKDNSINRSSHAFLPFAAGPRNCIGQQFAMSELKVMTALLLRHFRFGPDDNKLVQRINKAVMKSTTGIHVMVALREVEAK